MSRQRVPVSLGLLAIALATACQAPLPVSGALGPGVAAQAKRQETRPLPFGLGGKLTTIGTMAPEPAGTISGPTGLPTHADLRSGCSPIGNQGQTQSCSAFATVDGLAEYLARKQGDTTDYSPRFIWNLVRQNTHELQENVGIDYRDALRAVVQTGVVPERDFAFPSPAQQADPRSLLRFMGEAPPSALVAAAKAHRPVPDMQTVPDARTMKKLVAGGMPVVFGIMAFDSIVASRGPIPLPKDGEQQLGGHIMLCVGYDDAAKHFIVRNSWGREWGDKGYGYLPYDYIRKGWVHLGATAKL